MTKVDKAWGYELIVVNDAEAGYCGKIMHARPGRTSRIERHGSKDETFYVLDGVVQVELYGHEREPGAPTIAVLGAGDSLRIDPGTWHRFGALDPGTRFVEFSTFHDDADTERFSPRD